MKLKFLLMPFAVIIAIVTIIWYIWPGIFDKNDEKSIISLSKSIKSEQDEINKINEKKRSIDRLKSQLETDKEVVGLINYYYPSKFREENIINKINQLAFDSGIYVYDMDVEYDGDVDELATDLRIPEIKKKKATGLSENKATDPVSGNRPLNIGRVRKLAVLLDVYGRYEQIKKFASSLYYMGLLNNIQLFNISMIDSTKSEKMTGTGNNAGGDIEGDIEGAENGILELKIAVNFAAKENRATKITDMLSDPLFSVGRFNLDALYDRSDMMMQKYPNAEVGETGTENPFFPNENN